MATNQGAGRPSFAIVKSAIVVVKMGETTEQAWRRHVRKHPEDSYADVKIFHFISPNSTQNLLIA
ncbi:MAG: hypothetical protein ACYC6G_18970 [Desulfobaccales bacterium]